MRPLDGITVVTLEHAVAAPFATRQLADLGARVIKIERPGVGDFARAYDTRVDGLASYFVWINRSKESITLDVKHPEAGKVLGQLLAQADVLVQNLGPGAAARLGLSAEALRPAHPGLIVCDISGYGKDGPYRDKKAYDMLIQAEAGLLSVTGTDEQPSRAGISVADIAAGMYAYSNILAAADPARTHRSRQPYRCVDARGARRMDVEPDVLRLQGQHAAVARSVQSSDHLSVRSVPRRRRQDRAAGCAE